MTCFMLLACTLFSWACEDDAPNTGLVLLASDPPSLMLEQTIQATLTAEEPFFEANLAAPLTTNGGLIIDSLTVASELTATATFRAMATTEVGLHEFNLQQGSAVGTLTMSVLAPQPGPGTVTAENTTASSGARHAVLEVVGQGTGFDPNCTVHVLGAPGMEIAYYNVVNASRLQITYDIALEQPPVQATVAIIDGIQRYDIPFEIVAHTVLDSQAPAQTLTKGQVGAALLSHPQAGMNTATQLALDESSPIETGATQVQGLAQVSIPIRVPSDHPADQLHLQATTYTRGGAFLEIINTTVQLHEPAYLVARPARLNPDLPTQSATIAAQGMDLSALQTVQVNDPTSGVAVQGFAPIDATQVSVDVQLPPDTPPGELTLTLTTPTRTADVKLAIQGPLTLEIYPNPRQIPQGDRVQAVIVLNGADLPIDNVNLEGTGDIQVHSLTPMDEATLVAELEVAKDAIPNHYNKLLLQTLEQTYNVHVQVIESGVK